MNPCNVSIKWFGSTDVSTLGLNAFGQLELVKQRRTGKIAATFVAASEYSIGTYDSFEQAKEAAQKFLNDFVFSYAGIDGLLVGKSYFEFIKMGFSEATALCQQYGDNRFLAFALTFTDLDVRSQVLNSKLRIGDLISLKMSDEQWIATTVTDISNAESKGKFSAGNFTLDVIGYGYSWCFGLHESLNIFKNAVNQNCST